MRIGFHTAGAGSLEGSARKARELGANCFQLFSSSPRMWRGSSLKPADVAKMLEVRREFDLAPVAIHANYLINLASIDPEIRGKSVAAFRGELERGSQMEADYLVLHPGSFKGQTLESGILAFVEALVEAAGDFAGGKPMLLLENTVGAGSQIGQRFEQLKSIRDMAVGRVGLEIGYCLDTCHMLAAGYDIATAEGLAATVLEIEGTIGFELVKLIHANDSKGPVGSHLDRHENIGLGQIGESGFRRILTHPKFRGKPFLLETPFKDDAGIVKDLEVMKRFSIM